MILQRITPQNYTPEFTFDDVVETLLLILNIIRESGLESDTRVHNYSTPQTPAQLRVLVYFRLCGKLKMAEQLTAFYHESKTRGVPFTLLMYNFALRGVSHDFRVFPEFSSIVLRDMGREGYSPDHGIMRSLFRGWYVTRNMDKVISDFKVLERA
jgi:hypothetical protein